jgi:hypothetical protein
VRRLTLQSFGFFSVANDDKKCLYYTGLHLEIFHVIEKLCLRLVTVNNHNGKETKLQFKDRLFLTMVKLRLNLAYVDLGWRFGVSASTAVLTISTILPVLHKVVYQSMMEVIQSRLKNELSSPIVFAGFTNCCLVADCTEFRSEVPKKMDHQKMIYSSYKHYTIL